MDDMRVRRSPLGGSLTVDPTTGQLYMLMPGDSGTLHLLAQRTDGSWSSAKVPGMSGADDWCCASIRPGVGWSYSARRVTASTS